MTLSLRLLDACLNLLEPHCRAKSHLLLVNQGARQVVKQVEADVVLLKVYFPSMQKLDCPISSPDANLDQAAGTPLRV